MLLHHYSWVSSAHPINVVRLLYLAWFLYKEQQNIQRRSDDPCDLSFAVEIDQLGLVNIIFQRYQPWQGTFPPPITSVQGGWGATILLTYNVCCSAVWNSGEVCGNTVSETRKWYVAVLSFACACRAYLKEVNCIVTVPIQTVYSVGLQLIESMWVNKRPHTGQAMAQVMTAFCERFNKVPPWKATLLIWEKCALAIGSVKD
jgi:hypothetical protein